MRTKILYEDQHIFIIHKPSGIAVQSAQIGQMDVENELKNYLARQIRASATVGRDGRKRVSEACTTGKEMKASARERARKEEPSIYVIHRLDQPVEGLLVFAKTKEAAAGLNKQLAAGTLNKQYYAAVCGYLPEQSGEFVDYMKKEGNRVIICFGADKEAKKAVLRYRILEKAMAGEPTEKATGNLIEETAETKPDFSLADVYIETGRFHQIRCQMAHHGMPLLGDTKYGTEESKEQSRKLGVRQVALCAYKLECRHPVTGKQLSYQVHPENPAFALFK